MERQESHKCIPDGGAQCSGNNPMILEIIGNDGEGVKYSVNFCPFCGKKNPSYNYIEILTDDYEEAMYAN